jgi:hypothetical protein
METPTQIRVYSDVLVLKFRDIVTANMKIVHLMILVLEDLVVYLVTILRRNHRKNHLFMKTNQKCLVKWKMMLPQLNQVSSQISYVGIFLRTEIYIFHKYQFEKKQGRIANLTLFANYFHEKL